MEVPDQVRAEVGMMARTSGVAVGAVAERMKVKRIATDLVALVVIVHRCVVVQMTAMIVDRCDATNGTIVAR